MKIVLATVKEKCAPATAEATCMLATAKAKYEAVRTEAKDMLATVKVKDAKTATEEENYVIEEEEPNPGYDTAANRTHRYRRSHAGINMIMISLISLSTLVAYPICASIDFSELPFRLQCDKELLVINCGLGIVAILFHAQLYIANLVLKFRPSYGKYFP